VDRECLGIVSIRIAVANRFPVNEKKRPKPLSPYTFFIDFVFSSSNSGKTPVIRVAGFIRSLSQFVKVTIISFAGF
jgi:hypothetical protein